MKRFGWTLVAVGMSACFVLALAPALTDYRKDVIWYTVRYGFLAWSLLVVGLVLVLARAISKR